MLGPVPVIVYPADEGGTLANDNEMLINHNVNLESLTWVNTGASDAWIQIFNSPRKLAVPITNTNNSSGLITAPTHGFVTGDKVTLTDIAGVTSAYLQVGSVDTFYLTTTRAKALAGTLPDVLPTSNGDTGTLDLASNLTSPPLSEEYPVLAVGSAPSNTGSFSAARFTRGVYARAVTAAGGSTLIAGDDVQFTPRYSSGPIMGTTYED